MSELPHGNKTEPERVPAELEEVAARSLGAIAVIGNEAGEADVPAVTEEQNRDSSVHDGAGLADPEGNNATVLQSEPSNQTAPTVRLQNESQRGSQSDPEDALTGMYGHLQRSRIPNRSKQLGLMRASAQRSLGSRSKHH